MVGDIKLRLQAAALAESDRATVDPEMKGGVDAVEAQDLAGIVRILRKAERAAIGARWVLGGNLRGIDRERVDDIGVMGAAVAQHLPGGGDRDLVPDGVIEIDGLEPGGDKIGVLREREGPGAVEQAVVWCIATTHRARRFRRGIGGEVCARRQSVTVWQFVVLIIAALLSHRLLQIVEISSTTHRSEMPTKMEDKSSTPAISGSSRKFLLALEDGGGPSPIPRSGPLCRELLRMHRAATNMEL